MVIESVRKTVEKFRLLKKNSAVIIGVSGGADSLTLLLALQALSREYGLKLFVVHVDHGMRATSSADARFVQRFCKKQIIPVDVVRLKLRKDSRGSLEEACRTARLQALFSAARKHRSTTIALGHTLDDQAETVLMRLIRGSGLYGLAAIQPKRSINGFTVIRPLIETYRRDIETFLKRKDITPRRDETNAQDIFLRNRVRAGLIPLLAQKYNPNIKAVLAHTAQTVSDDYDLLTSLARKELKRMGGRISLKRFTLIHPALQKLLLRLAIAATQGDTRRISHKHIEELQDLIFNRPIGSIVHLPQGLRGTKLKTRLFLSIKS